MRFIPHPRDRTKIRKGKLEGHGNQTLRREDIHRTESPREGRKEEKYKVQTPNIEKRNQKKEDKARL